MNPAPAAAADGAPRAEWRGHGLLILPCIAGIVLCSVQGYSLGVMIGPLEREFGWSRAQIATGPLIVSMLALLLSPFAGIAIDRFGPRKIALFGVVTFCAAIASLATANSSLASWWLRWSFVGLANVAVIPLVWIAAINRCFDRSRGLALAVALSGSGIGAAVLPLATADLIQHVGWRGAYLGLALAGAVITIPLTFALFRVPRAGASPIDQMEARPAIGTALRSGVFVKLALASALFTIAICMLTANLVPVLISRGLTLANAAQVAGAMGIGSIVGRLCGGLLLDRLPARLLAAACVSMPMITVGMLLAMTLSTTVAVMSCLILGLAIGAELDTCAYLAARHFGSAHFGTLFGVINGLLLLGTGVAPMIAGLVYDVTGSYSLVLWMQFPACILAALLFVSLGPYPSLVVDGRTLSK